MSLRNKQNVHIENNNRWSIIINLPTPVLGDAFISLKYSSRHNNIIIIIIVIKRTRYILCTRIMTIKKVHNVIVKSVRRETDDYNNNMPYN